MQLRFALPLLTLAAAAIVTTDIRAVPTVTIPVTVTDRSGESVVTPLTAEHFRVLEDGKEQQILSVEAGPGPVSVSIVLDTSQALIGPSHHLGDRVIEQLTAKLAPEDEISLMTYHNGTHWAATLPWTRGSQVRTFEGTFWHTLPFSDFLNGIRNGLFLMDRAAHPRRAVLGLTALEEVATSWSLSKYVVTQAQSETAIYGMHILDLRSPVPRFPASGLTDDSVRGRMINFDDLLKDGGGRLILARSPQLVDRGTERFLDELRKQYVIRYTPAKAFDGTYRRLKVELKNTKDLKIRHRLGYLAQPPRA